MREILNVLNTRMLRVCANADATQYVGLWTTRAAAVCLFDVAVVLFHVAVMLVLLSLLFFVVCVLLLLLWQLVAGFLVISRLFVLCCIFPTLSRRAFLATSDAAGPFHQ